MGISGITMAMMSIISLVVICISGTSLAFRLDSRIPASRIPNSCVTGTGSTCVFPFKYKDVEYYECTYAESPLPWCATQTDSSGSVVTGKWGDCQISTSSSCTACTTTGGPASGQDCVFPFTYNGVTHNSCADWVYGGQTSGTTWCSTKVDSSGVHVNNEGNYGFCPDSAQCTTSVAPRSNSAGAVVFFRVKPN